MWRAYVAALGRISTGQRGRAHRRWGPTLKHGLQPVHEQPTAHDQGGQRVAAEDGERGVCKTYAAGRKAAAGSGCGGVALAAADHFAEFTVDYPGLDSEYRKARDRPRGAR